MLFLLILLFATTVLNMLGAFLPVVTELPFGSDDALVSAIGYFLYVADLFPPLFTLYEALLIYITFLGALKVIAMIPFVRNSLYVPNSGNKV